MKTAIMLVTCLFLATLELRSEEIETKEYRGVVTYQLLPAKVLKINKIIKDPTPGNSYIGEEGILVEVAENPEVMANWTIVSIKYKEYKAPKVIRYKLLSEEKEISVKIHAVSLTIDGDLSNIIKKERE